MKILALFLLVAFIVAVHRQARNGFVVAYCIACLLFYFSLAGCATERLSPGPAPTGVICGNDGAYMLIHCRGKNP